MSTPRPAPSSRPPGWQQEHARRYLATGGQDGHIWEGVTTLLLTTTGRRSGQSRTTPLIYGATASATWWWPPAAAPRRIPRGTRTSSRSRRCRCR